MAATQTLYRPTGAGRLFQMFGHGLAYVVAPIVNFVTLMNRANGAALQYEHLSRLSDSALAARGVARKDIGQMVMNRFQSETS